MPEPTTTAATTAGAEKSVPARMAFNLNNVVFVRLLPRGEAMYAAYWREANLEPLPLRPDADGYVEFQLWYLAHVFGPGMVMGFDPPIEMTVYLPVPNDVPRDAMDAAAAATAAALPPPSS
jgi:hypothetical protein